MAPMQMKTTWGGRRIAYELTREARRDLAITVHPDLRVTVRAPSTKPIELVVSRVEAKRAWIARRLREFEQFHPLPVPRRYVSGETHWYLGRQYRLRVIHGATRVSCHAGAITVCVPTPHRANSVSAALDAWYRQRAKAVFAERMGLVQQQHRRLRGLESSVRVRRMRSRWGSCTARGTITLNPELLKAPKLCIDYVLVHELLHVIVPAHDRRFFRLLGEILPDWEGRRRRLNQMHQ